ncbi:MAG TPA: aminotransferase class I/II-fold pyridoxal phosphate-dependent enzyme [Pedobacter sp.]|jgi:threonine-phosphate decarboxylase
MLHGHGDDSYRFNREIVADFSTNVWYGGEPVGLKDHLFKRWEIINRYPEVIAESLTEKIAAQHNLNPNNILVNNGTTESIYLIAQLFQKSKTLIVVPSFSEYEDACSLYQHEISFINWNELNADYKFDSELFFICNPNNPTGAVFYDFEKLIASNPTVTFVLDEAFIDFTLSITSAIKLINTYKNLIILHSLTKNFAIPGLRLGYIAADKIIIDKLKSYKFPWSVNSLALEAGHFIYDHFSSVQIPLKQLLADKRAFENGLQNAPVSILDSETHFFTAESQKGTASDLKAFLIENFGILIRDASNFRGLNEKHFRIATLSPQKNQLLITALEAWNNH